MPVTGSKWVVDKEQLYLTNWQYQIMLDIQNPILLAYYMPQPPEYAVPSLGDQITIKGDPETYVVTRFSPTPPDGKTPLLTTQTSIFVRVVDATDPINDIANYPYEAIVFDNIY